MLMAVDTSTQMMGLALYDGDRVLGEMVWQTRNHHTVELAPAVDSLLKRCGVASDALSVLGVALGPGSFTSLRIGLAIAKGLALSLRIPVAGIPTLDIIAACQPVGEQPLIALLKAGRDRLAGCEYRAVEGMWQAQGEIFMTSARELESRIERPTIICGEIDAEDRKTLERRWRNAILASPAQNVRRPAILAQLAEKRLETGRADDVVSLAPIYLRTLNTPAES